MHRSIRLGLVVLCALAIAGCGGITRLLTRSDPAPAAAAKDNLPPPPPPPPPPVLARSLFPEADRAAEYGFVDGTQSAEFMIPDGDRLVQTYNGTVYITWFFTEQGVLRSDPKAPGQGVLLRFLPATLADGQVWWQPSRGEKVWFHLTRLPSCVVPGQSPAECWRLQVLNRGDLTAFVFASGLGVVGAVSENTLQPKESFGKSLITHQTAQIPEKEKAAFLARGAKLADGTPAAVEAATEADLSAVLPKRSG